MAESLTNLSIEELENMKKKLKQVLNTKYSEYKKKQKLIADVLKLNNAIEKLNPNNKHNNKPNNKPANKPKTKTFEEYFQECIRNKTIPPDTPSYLRKALERAIKEYDQGIEKETSALDGFANKYIVKEKPGIFPNEFLKCKYGYLKEFLKNHQNNKVKFVLVCLMEIKQRDLEKEFFVEDKAYFHSDMYINIA